MITFLIAFGLGFALGVIWESIRKNEPADLDNAPDCKDCGQQMFEYDDDGIKYACTCWETWEK